MRILILFLTIIAVVFADQISKWWILETFIRQDGVALGFIQWMTHTMRLPFHQVELLSNLNFVMVWNEGVSFGLFNNIASGAIILSIASIIISIGLSIWMIREHNRFTAYCIAYIVGGALGNVLDRLRFGGVADFIDIHIAGYHWPAFNIADSAITIGVALLLIHGIFFEKDKE